MVSIAAIKSEKPSDLSRFGLISEPIPGLSVRFDKDPTQYITCVTRVAMNMSHVTKKGVKVSNIQTCTFICTCI